MRCTWRPLTWTPRAPSATVSQTPRRSTQKRATGEAPSSTRPIGIGAIAEPADAVHAGRQRQFGMVAVA